MFIWMAVILLFLNAKLPYKVPSNVVIDDGLPYQEEENTCISFSVTHSQMDLNSFSCQMESNRSKLHNLFLFLFSQTKATTFRLTIMHLVSTEPEKWKYGLIAHFFCGSKQWRTSFQNTKLRPCLIIQFST